MGTSGPRSRRSSTRGLASSVAFLLLFAFALGQSGSLMAIAGGDSRGSALPAPQAPAADGNASTSTGDATPATRSAPAAGKLKLEDEFLDLQSRFEGQLDGILSADQKKALLGMEFSLLRFTYGKGIFPHDLSKGG